MLISYSFYDIEVTHTYVGAEIRIDQEHEAAKGNVKKSYY